MAIKYDRQDINIAVGEKAFSKIKNLKYNGEVIGTKIVHLSSNTPVNHAVNVSVEEASGAVIGSTDFRDYIAQGGSYVDGFKPCAFNSQNEITVNAIATENIATAEFKAQLIFMIEEGCNN